MNIEVLGVKLPAVNITGLAKPAFMPACVRQFIYFILGVNSLNTGEHEVPPVC